MAVNKLSEKSRCAISYSDISENTREFLELVAEPRFVCLKCCRVAAKKKNLCRGKKLKEKEKKVLVS